MGASDTVYMRLKRNGGNSHDSINFDAIFTQAPVVPESTSSTFFIVGGATLGVRRYRNKFKK